MLRVEGVHVYYGVIHALKGVTVTVEPGEIVAVLGANGAGKSTLLRAITGVVQVQQGRVAFEGRVLDRMPIWKRVALGIAMVPEGRGVFPNLTVRENLLLGAYLHRRDREMVERQLRELLAWFPPLRAREGQGAATLSGGEQQMLAICRALMSRPRLLLLDEPSMGLGPLLVRNLFRLIREIRDQGTTVLLVEQNASAALRVADRAYVLEMGGVVHEGTAKQLMGNRQVRAAYLA